MLMLTCIDKLAALMLLVQTNRSDQQVRTVLQLQNGC